MQMIKHRRQYAAMVSQYCLTILTLLIGTSCTRTPDEKTLEITGSSTVAPLVAEIAKEFETLNPSFRVNVQTGGSSRGISDTIKGTADIGMVSRRLHKNEQHLESYTLAHDGIGIITHSDVDLKNLSSDNIRKVFTGSYKSWNELSKNEKKITVVHKAQGRSTSELFIKYFDLKYSDVKAHIIIGDNEQGIKNVSNIPGAIGYVSIGAAESAIKSGVAIRLLKLDGAIPSSKTVAQGKYPILRPLNLVIKNNNNAAALKFIKFAQSKKAFDIVRKLDFVPNAI